MLTLGKLSFVQNSLNNGIMGFSQKVLAMVCVTFALLAAPAFSQKVSNIDFDKIKKNIKKSGNLNYKSLLKRYHNLDTTLTHEELVHLYYGEVFQKNYSPYGSAAEEKIFNEKYKNESFEEALKLGLAIHKGGNVNVRLLFRIAIAYLAQDQMEKGRPAAILYFKLIDVIYQSGDGKSIETAFVVTKVADEYDLLYEMGLRMTMQSLVGVTDVLTIDIEAQELEEGQEPIEKVYFNVSKPLESIGKMFK